MATAVAADTFAETAAHTKRDEKSIPEEVEIVLDKLPATEENKKVEIINNPHECRDEEAEEPSKDDDDDEGILKGESGEKTSSHSEDTNEGTALKERLHEEMGTLTDIVGGISENRRENDEMQPVEPEVVLDKQAPKETNTVEIDNPHEFLKNNEDGNDRTVEVEKAADLPSAAKAIEERNCSPEPIENPINKEDEMLPIEPGVVLDIQAPEETHTIEIDNPRESLKNNEDGNDGPVDVEKAVELPSVAKAIEEPNSSAEPIEKPINTEDEILPVQPEVVLNKQAPEETNKVEIDNPCESLKNNEDGNGGTVEVEKVVDSVAKAIEEPKSSVEPIEKPVNAEDEMLPVEPEVVLDKQAPEETNTVEIENPREFLKNNEDGNDGTVEVEKVAEIPSAAKAIEEPNSSAEPIENPINTEDEMLPFEPEVVLDKQVPEETNMVEIDNPHESLKNNEDGNDGTAEVGKEVELPSVAKAIEEPKCPAEPIGKPINTEDVMPEKLSLQGEDRGGQDVGVLLTTGIPPNESKHKAEEPSEVLNKDEGEGMTQDPLVQADVILNCAADLTISFKEDGEKSGVCNENDSTQNNLATKTSFPKDDSSKTNFQRMEEKEQNKVLIPDGSLVVESCYDKEYEKIEREECSAGTNEIAPRGLQSLSSDNTFSQAVVSSPFSTSATEESNTVKAGSCEVDAESEKASSDTIEDEIVKEETFCQDNKRDQIFTQIEHEGTLNKMETEDVQGVNYLLASQSVASEIKETNLDEAVPVIPKPLADSAQVSETVLQVDINTNDNDDNHQSKILEKDMADGSLPQENPKEKLSDMITEPEKLASMEAPRGLHTDDNASVTVCEGISEVKKQCTAEMSKDDADSKNSTCENNAEISLYAVHEEIERSGLQQNTELTFRKELILDKIDDVILKGESEDEFSHSENINDGIALHEKLHEEMATIADIAEGTSETLHEEMGTLTDIVGGISENQRENDEMQPVEPEVVLDKQAPEETNIVEIDNPCESLKNNKDGNDGTVEVEKAVELPSVAKAIEEPNSSAEPFENPINTEDEILPGQPEVVLDKQAPEETNKVEIDNPYESLKNNEDGNGGTVEVEKVVDSVAKAIEEPNSSVEPIEKPIYAEDEMLPVEPEVVLDKQAPEETNMVEIDNPRESLKNNEDGNDGTVLTSAAKAIEEPNSSVEPIEKLITAEDEMQPVEPAVVLDKPGPEESQKTNTVEIYNPRESLKNNEDGNDGTVEVEKAVELPTGAKAIEEPNSLPEPIENPINTGDEMLPVEPVVVLDKQSPEETNTVEIDNPHESLKNNEDGNDGTVEVEKAVELPLFAKAIEEPNSSAEPIEKTINTEDEMLPFEPEVVLDKQVPEETNMFEIDDPHESLKNNEDHNDGTAEVEKEVELPSVGKATEEPNCPTEPIEKPINTEDEMPEKLSLEGENRGDKDVGVLLTRGIPPNESKYKAEEPLEVKQQCTAEMSKDDADSKNSTCESKVEICLYVVREEIERSGLQQNTETFRKELILDKIDDAILKGESEDKFSHSENINGGIALDEKQLHEEIATIADITEGTSETLHEQMGTMTDIVGGISENTRENDEMQLVEPGGVLDKQVPEETSTVEIDISHEYLKNKEDGTDGTVENEEAVELPSAAKAIEEPKSSPEPIENPINTEDEMLPVEPEVMLDKQAPEETSTVEIDIPREYLKSKEDGTDGTVEDEEAVELPSAAKANEEPKSSPKPIENPINTEDEMLPVEPEVVLDKQAPEETNTVEIDNPCESLKNNEDGNDETVEVEKVVELPSAAKAMEEHNSSVEPIEKAINTEDEMLPDEPGVVLDKQAPEETSTVEIDIPHEYLKINEDGKDGTVEVEEAVELPSAAKAIEEPKSSPEPIENPINTEDEMLPVELEVVLDKQAPEETNTVEIDNPCESLKNNEDGDDGTVEVEKAVELPSVAKAIEEPNSSAEPIENPINTDDEILPVQLEVVLDKQVPEETNMVEIDNPCESLKTQDGNDGTVEVEKAIEEPNSSVEPIEKPINREDEMLPIEPEVVLDKQALEETNTVEIDNRHEFLKKNEDGNDGTVKAEKAIDLPSAAKAIEEPNSSSRESEDKFSHSENTNDGIALHEKLHEEMATIADIAEDTSETKRECDDKALPIEAEAVFNKLVPEEKTVEFDNPHEFLKRDEGSDETVGGENVIELPSVSKAIVEEHNGSQEPIGKPSKTGDEMPEKLLSEGENRDGQDMGIILNRGIPLNETQQEAEEVSNVLDKDDGKGKTPEEISVQADLTENLKDSEESGEACKEQGKPFIPEGKNMDSMAVESSDDKEYERVEKEECFTQTSKIAPIGTQSLCSDSKNFQAGTSSPLSISVTEETGSVKVGSSEVDHESVKASFDKIEGEIVKEEAFSQDNKKDQICTRIEHQITCNDMETENAHGVDDLLGSQLVASEITKTTLDEAAPPSEVFTADLQGEINTSDNDYSNQSKILEQDTIVDGKLSSACKAQENPEEKLSDLITEHERNLPKESEGPVSTEASRGLHTDENETTAVCEVTSQMKQHGIAETVKDDADSKNSICQNGAEKNLNAAQEQIEGSCLQQNTEPTTFSKELISEQSNEGILEGEGEDKASHSQITDEGITLQEKQLHEEVATISDIAKGTSETKRENDEKTLPDEHEVMLNKLAPDESKKVEIGNPHEISKSGEEGSDGTVECEKIIELPSVAKDTIEENNRFTKPTENPSNTEDELPGKLFSEGENREGRDTGTILNREILPNESQPEAEEPSKALETDDDEGMTPEKTFVQADAVINCPADFTENLKEDCQKSGEVCNENDSTQCILATKTSFPNDDSNETNAQGIADKEQDKDFIPEGENMDSLVVESHDDKEDGKVKKEESLAETCKIPLLEIQSQSSDSQDAHNVIGSPLSTSPTEETSSEKVGSSEVEPESTKASSDTMEDEFVKQEIFSYGSSSCQISSQMKHNIEHDEVETETIQGVNDLLESQMVSPEIKETGSGEGTSVSEMTADPAPLIEVHRTVLEDGVHMNENKEDHQCKIIEKDNIVDNSVTVQEENITRAGEEQASEEELRGLHRDENETVVVHDVISEVEQQETVELSKDNVDSRDSLFKYESEKENFHAPCEETEKAALLQNADQTAFNEELISVKDDEVLRGESEDKAAHSDNNGETNPQETNMLTVDLDEAKSIQRNENSEWANYSTVDEKPEQQIYTATDMPTQELKYAYETNKIPEIEVLGDTSVQGQSDLDLISACPADIHVAEDTGENTNEMCLEEVADMQNQEDQIKQDGSQRAASEVRGNLSEGIENEISKDCVCSNTIIHKEESLNSRIPRGNEEEAKESKEEIKEPVKEANYHNIQTTHADTEEQVICVLTNAQNTMQSEEKMLPKEKECHVQNFSLLKTSEENEEQISETAEPLMAATGEMETELVEVQGKIAPVSSGLASEKDVVTGNEIEVDAVETDTVPNQENESSLNRKVNVETVAAGEDTDTREMSLHEEQIEACLSITDDKVASSLEEESPITKIVNETTIAETSSPLGTREGMVTKEILLEEKQHSVINSKGRSLNDLEEEKLELNEKSLEHRTEDFMINSSDSTTKVHPKSVQPDEELIPSSQSIAEEGDESITSDGALTSSAEDTCPQKVTTTNFKPESTVLEKTQVGSRNEEIKEDCTIADDSTMKPQECTSGEKTFYTQSVENEKSIEVGTTETSKNEDSKMFQDKLVPENSNVEPKNLDASYSTDKEIQGAGMEETCIERSEIDSEKSDHIIESASEVHKLEMPLEAEKIGSVEENLAETETEEIVIKQINEVNDIIKADISSKQTQIADQSVIVKSSLDYPEEVLSLDAYQEVELKPEENELERLGENESIKEEASSNDKAGAESSAAQDSEALHAIETAVAEESHDGNGKEISKMPMLQEQVKHSIAVEKQNEELQSIVDGADSEKTLEDEKLDSCTEVQEGITGKTDRSKKTESRTPSVSECVQLMQQEPVLTAVQSEIQELETEKVSGAPSETEMNQPKTNEMSTNTSEETSHEHVHDEIQSDVITKYQVLAHFKDSDITEEECPLDLKVMEIEQDKCSASESCKAVPTEVILNISTEGSNSGAEKNQCTKPELQEENVMPIKSLTQGPGETTTEMAKDGEIEVQQKNLDFSFNIKDLAMENSSTETEQKDVQDNIDIIESAQEHVPGHLYELQNDEADPAKIQNDNSTDSEDKRSKNEATEAAYNEAAGSERGEDAKTEVEVNKVTDRSQTMESSSISDSNLVLGSIEEFSQVTEHVDTKSQTEKLCDFTHKDSEMTQPREFPSDFTEIKNYIDDKLAQHESMVDVLDTEFPAEADPHENTEVRTSSEDNDSQEMQQNSEATTINNDLEEMKPENAGETKDNFEGLVFQEDKRTDTSREKLDTSLTQSTILQESIEQILKPNLSEDNEAENEEQIKSMQEEEDETKNMKTADPKDIVQSMKEKETVVLSAHEEDPKESTYENNINASQLPQDKSEETKERRTPTEARDGTSMEGLPCASLNEREVIFYKEEQASKVETEQHEEARSDEEEEEHKGEDSGPEAPVIVENAAGDADAKAGKKKHHNILSGVGSKVKHSIAKVKKVITGKSSPTKQQSSK